MDRQQESGARAAVARPPRHWRLTADQYQRMGDTGILHEDDRVELLDGELYEMAPIGDWHNGSVDGLNWWLAPHMGTRALLRVQGSFRLSPYSEPQPDLMLLRFRSDFYRSLLPGPEDVLLLVEVADSSFGYDRDVKLPLYARAGIPEVWIVDRRGARIGVYREPDGAGYRSVTLVERGGSVAPLAFPDLAIPVEAITG